MGARKRVDDYDQPILPGCDGGGGDACVFHGTNADWANLRTSWINGCYAASNHGFLHSKKKTMSTCTGAFDERAAGIAMGVYAKNEENTKAIKASSLLAGGQNTTMIIAFLFVGLIFYLLTSD